MKLARLILIAALLAPRVALAQFGVDGFSTHYIQGRAAFLFTAPAAGDYATLTATTGQTITCTRASTTTVLTGAGATPTVVASGHCAVDYRGLQAEAGSTNFLLNSGAPATQTTASLGTNSYTGWMDGTGSVAFTVGTATATGLPCTASSGVACPFTVTVAGTVTATVSGSPTREQLENLSFRTSYIPTAGTSVSRAGDVNTFPKPASVSIATGPWSISATAQTEVANLVQIALGTNSNYAMYFAVRNNAATAAITNDTSASMYATESYSNQTNSTKYAATLIGTSLTVYVSGVAGSTVTPGTTPLEPTTVIIGDHSSDASHRYLNGWVSTACIASSSTGCPP